MSSPIPISVSIERNNPGKYRRRNDPKPIWKEKINYNGKINTYSFIWKKEKEKLKMNRQVDTHKRWVHKYCKWVLSASWQKFHPLSMPQMKLAKLKHPTEPETIIPC